MTKTKKSRKLILTIVLVVLAAVLIGFGSVYIYYSTGHGAADPMGFASIRGLNNAEDMVQIGDTKWVLTGNLGDKSWKEGGLYLIDSESLEWKKAEIDFSGTPDEGYEEIADPELFSSHGIAVKQIDAIFISHAHGDHYGGLSKIIKAFPVKWLYIPDTGELDKYQKGYGNKLRQQAKKAANVRWVKQGDSFTIGEIKGRCLFICPAKELSEHDPHHFVNNESAQYEFTLGRAVFNSGGDMQNAANRVMVKKGIQFRAHIALLKWHTDANATNDIWVEGVTSGIVLIRSDGKKVTTLFKSNYHNKEGSGRGTTRKRCEARGGVVYRNHEDGHIFYKIKGSTITVTTSKSRRKDIYTICDTAA